MPHLYDPLDQRPLHFLGIGGAGMSALALAARRRGVAVSGCDPDDTAFPDLIAAGVQVSSSSSRHHIENVRALVATAAVSATHPEVMAAISAGVPVVPRKEALAELVNGTTLVGLAGTHGKTTTTVMTTEALRAVGAAPSGLAGGRVASWGGNALLDGERLWVVEADEYDRAFLTLQPTVAVINNVEADHMECYGTLDVLYQSFATFAGGAVDVFIGTTDSGSDAVAALLGDRVIRFGLEPESDIRVIERQAQEGHNRGIVAWPDGLRVELELRVPGDHNLRNAVAALAVVRALGYDPAVAASALSSFTGVARRFERHGEVAGVAIVDDYAHHQTELVATLSAARQAFPDRRLVAVFQPHLFSRTRDHGASMGSALAAADVVVVANIHPAREQPIEGVTGALVADAASLTNDNVHHFPDRETLAELVVELLQPGDVVLTLGAGDITRLAGSLAVRLGERL